VFVLNFFLGESSPAGLSSVTFPASTGKPCLCFPEVCVPTRSLIAMVINYLAPTVISILVYAAILWLLYKFGAASGFAREFNKNSTPGAILTIVNSGGVYLIVLAASAQYACTAVDFAYNVAAATFGLAMGWVLGIVISPGSKDEASEFSLLTKAISTFLTGYVLANLKGITQTQVWHFLNTPGVAFRLLIGTACCFSTVAVVFVSRRAEIMKANAIREWFISYAPGDPKHLQGLRADVLARGPFQSRDDALAEINLIKGRDEFKACTLTPVRVDIIVEQATPPASEPTDNPKAPVDEKTNPPE
jgi:hypothetical protein